VAPISRVIGADKSGAPYRIETVVWVQFAQAGEASVYKEKLIVLPRHLVDIDVAGVILCSGKEKCVVFAVWLKRTCRCWRIAQITDPEGRANCQPIRFYSHSHWLPHRPEVGVSDLSVGPHQHQLSRLIGTDRQCDPGTLQDLSE
jgi:hypothetical protein